MRSSHRLITFLAAILIGIGAFLPWVGNALPDQYPAKDLVAGNSGQAPANFYVSFAMVLIVAAVLALMALVIGPRDLAWGAFVIVLVAGLLYVVRHQADLQVYQRGFWITGAGLILLAIGGLSGARSYSWRSRRRSYD